MPKTFLSIQQAAAALNVHPRTFRNNFLKANVIRPILLGGKRKVFLAADVEKLKQK